MATPLERVRAEVERQERVYTPAKVPGIYADLRKLIDLADEVQAVRMRVPQSVYDAWYEVARDDATREESS